MISVVNLLQERYIVSNDSRITTPDISVIVPIYNAENYLDQALDSIQAQTMDTIEILCLNDGSTDGSLNIMQRHAEEDSRIRVIDKQNEGYGATCNRGIDEARGLYISIVEPDDWIEPDMYADMFIYASTFDAMIDIVKTPYWRIFMPDTPKQAKLHCSYHHRVKPPTQPFTIDQAAHLLCHHPSIWSALYRRGFIEENNIRFMPIPGAGWADNPFLVETLCQAKTIIYLDKPYYCYREDTPEKSTQFARRSTLLPLQRWNDMMDVLERLNVTDENVLRAQNSRGFTYLSGIIEEVDLGHPEVRKAAIQMFKRMDPELVLSDPEISPGCKRMFLELLGLPVQHINHIPHIIGLIKAGLFNLFNTESIPQTWYMTRSYLTKRKKREGGKFIA